MILRGISTPVQGGDAVNKAYVDAANGGGKGHLLEAGGYWWDGYCSTHNPVGGASSFYAYTITPINLSDVTNNVRFSFSGVSWNGKAIDVPLSLLTNCPPGAINVEECVVACIDIPDSVTDSAFTITKQNDNLRIEPSSTTAVIGIGTFILHYNQSGA